MKRRILTKDELAQVVRLRAREGNNWVAIQELTGIPRRIAQREFEGWENDQGRRSLETVRKEVAAAEFAKHLDVLQETADEFVFVLAPPLSSESRQAKDVISTAIRELGSGRLLEQEDQGVLQTMSPKQREWMFESLRAHTRESVPWPDLSQWCRQWDSCIRVRPEMRSELTGGILGLDKIIDDSEDLARIKDAIWHETWMRTIYGRELWTEPEEIAGVLRGLTLSPESGAKLSEVAEVGTAGLLQFARVSDNYTDANKILKHMKDAAERLTDSLDPFRLKPVLLRTRCDLCPA